MSHRGTHLVRSVVLAGVAVAAVNLLRGRCLRWGAADDEVSSALPGDELTAHADLSATRAVTIETTTAEVWPWIAQLGQGRGGFHSYDFAENLLGCDIHSAKRIVQEWQHVEVGAKVNLAPEFALTVADLDVGRALVLRGGALPGLDSAPYDFTWAFVLREGANGTTRLVVRERCAYLSRWAPLLVEPVELVSFVMSRKMLLGTKERAERMASAPPPT
ncbi:hypothetical protein [Allokutzneria sp. NRRL B-24872]|uniref:hypothetical protein n=1 Tax=Allokutzneria sp. NRRL B-24872 TaxID=1137961 RepID=UPI000A377619|nr:hypothetical protein [Allokutzneria sp. NRRL B-24872]